MIEVLSEQPLSRPLFQSNLRRSEHAGVYRDWLVATYPSYLPGTRLPICGLATILSLKLDQSTIRRITQATAPEEIESIRSLFREYQAWLKVDLCFQGFQEELASLPGAYAPPRGRLLLATEAGQSVGCVAIRPFADSTCEMKRLFVRPEFQGRGLGRHLAETAIAEARKSGYSAMVLDTLPRMQNAVRLYESLGFIRRPAYYDTPLQGTVFMELRL